MAEREDWVKSGWLWKRNDGLFQTWSKRFVCVKSRQLVCFRTDKDVSPKYTMSLEKAKLHNEGALKRKKFDHCFSVVHIDDMWILCAEDAASKDEWMKTIKQCVPSNSLKKSKSLGDLNDVKDITAPDENKKSREAPASTSSLPQKKRSLDDSGKTPDASDAKPKNKDDAGKEDNAEKKEKEKDPDDKRPDPIKVIVKDVAELSQDKDGKYFVDRCGIAAETLDANFDLLLGIINFIQRQKKFVNPNAKSDGHHRRSRPKPDEAVLAKLEEEIISPPPPDYKKLFKHPEQVGEGGFGLVVRADVSGDKQKPKLPSTVAIKKMSHSSLKERSNNLREIGFLRKLDHLNIVRYYRTYRGFNLKDVKPPPAELWLIMEYLEGGTLSQARLSHKFQEENIAYIARELLTGITYLHSLNLAHRDLKSANVMLSVEGGVKMIDFGLCADMSQGPRDDVCGSPFWLPPEMIKNETHSTPVDLWSYAICLMELANGTPPHEQSATKAMFIAATEGYPQPFDNPDKWSPEMKNFFSKCLVIDPSKRITAKELLKDPWLNKASTKKTMKNILTDIFIRDTLQSVGFGGF
eukprot:TRINITY_DN744_c0_g1_i1.p1 TRINITY_DN744_c0_g1~~TRINITY_DN744_c0_g1_i1.p1  ORF type:complete len:579 (+),score=132.05 TRINITY_DN744_c0_g1_i1:180-1916(+)